MKQKTDEEDRKEIRAGTEETTEREIAEREQRCGGQAKRKRERNKRAMRGKWMQEMQKEEKRRMGKMPGKKTGCNDVDGDGAMRRRR